MSNIPKIMQVILTVEVLSGESPLQTVHHILITVSISLPLSTANSLFKSSFNSFIHFLVYSELVTQTLDLFAGFSVFLTLVSLLVLLYSLYVFTRLK